MKILLKTESSDPDFNADCECAVLDVTPELLQQIKARVKIARQAAKADSDLWELYFWGGAPPFHGYDLIEACAEAAAESGDPGQDGWERRTPTKRSPRPPRTSRARPRWTPRLRICNRWASR